MMFLLEKDLWFNVYVLKVINFFGIIKGCIMVWEYVFKIYWKYLIMVELWYWDWFILLGFG